MHSPPKHPLFKYFNIEKKDVRNQAESTNWRCHPGVGNSRDLIKKDIVDIFRYSICFGEGQNVHDLATILEFWLFLCAPSWREYLEEETLNKRLLAVIPKLHGATKYRNLVPICEYVLSIRGPSNPSTLEEIVLRSNMFPSITNVDELPNSSNMETSSKSTNPYFQHQHEENVGEHMINNRGSLGSNTKNVSMTLETSTGNSDVIKPPLKKQKTDKSVVVSSIAKSIFQHEHVDLDDMDQIKYTDSLGSKQEHESTILKTTSFGNLDLTAPPMERINVDCAFGNSSINNSTSDFQPQHADSGAEMTLIKNPDYLESNQKRDPMVLETSTGKSEVVVLPKESQKSHHAFDDSSINKCTSNFQHQHANCGGVDLITYTDCFGPSTGIPEMLLPPKKRQIKDHALGVSVVNNLSPSTVQDVFQSCTPEITKTLDKQPLTPLSKELMKGKICDEDLAPDLGIVLMKTSGSEKEKKKEEDFEDKEVHASRKIESKSSIEFNQPTKDARKEVINPEVELEKETMPSNQMVNGASLTKFLTHDQIREHIMSFGQQYDQSKTEDNNESRPCQLCGIHDYFFTSQIYCVICEVRIEKNAYYYCKSADSAKKEYWFCTSCHKNSQPSYISFNGTSISKKRLDKKINDYVVEEPWVQCDKCQKWQHQICALYTSKSDLEEDYLCPKCCLNEIENGLHVPLPKPKAATFGAKDFPKTMLSEHIEQRLFNRLAQEREEMANKEAKNLYEVLAAENLCVRVLSSVNKQLTVKKEFLDILSPENYPSEFSYGSKVIFLFQKIEGVDVCLFIMEVQEFGSDCGYPNQNCVYISYLDSVKYLRPEREAVTGEPLRTFIYHEILIGYLDYCKKRGFATCYIWSCPPKKGFDYFLHCHPETQKIPNASQLWNWYHSMLKKAAKENIVVSLTNVYNRFFHPTKKCDYKLTVARLPYFDGDYWSRAAMNLFREIKETEGKGIKKVQQTQVTKTTLKAMEHANPSETSKDALVMQKLGKKILPSKKNFIVVELQHACTQCHELIMSGKRWFCNECKEFQQCERCHSADMHITATKKKHALNHVVVDDIPSDINEKDIIMDNELLETRDKFLTFCQNNNFQFDTLRRAKYSSFMILFHLKNLLC